MENEQKKSDNHNRIYFIIIALVLCFAVYCTLRGCGNDVDIERLHKNTDEAVERIEAEHAVVGSELDAASGELNSAKTAISRADELVERSQERITENTASINECQRIVSDCRKIVTDCNRIIGEVEKANRSGTGSGGGS